MTEWLLVIVLSDSPQQRMVEPMQTWTQCVRRIEEIRKDVIPEKTEFACYRLDRRGAYLRRD